MENKSYSNISSFGKELLQARTLYDGLPIIGKYAKGIIDAERYSIFIYDNEKKELWTTLADGIDRIIIDFKKGIVGRALELEETVIENDIVNSVYFLGDVDQKSGFTTKNIIATPIFNSKHKVIGILELLNKEGGFNDEDKKFMKFFTNYISGFIELASLSSDKE